MKLLVMALILFCTACAQTPKKVCMTHHLGHDAVSDDPHALCEKAVWMPTPVSQVTQVNQPAGSDILSEDLKTILTRLRYLMNTTQSTDPARMSFYLRQLEAKVSETQRKLETSK